MYFKTLIFILYVIVGLALFSICYATRPSHICSEISNKTIKGRFSTKTGYFNSAKDESYWKNLDQETQGCIPIKIWFLTRHGTRYPIDGDVDGFEIFPKLIKQILDNHLKGLGCLNEQDVLDLQSWIEPFEPRDRGELHAIGAEEMYSMGEYWRDLFPDVFTDSYDSSRIKVEFTVRNRTGQSAYHFLRGLYGDEAIGKIPLPKPYDPNFILRFYRSCPRWLRDVKNNSTTFRERNLFQQTKIMEETLQAVSEALGFQNMLPFEHLRVIYEECRFETAWFPEKRSIWCKPFRARDIEIMEYHQDLKYYYEDSYGTPLNREIACKTLSDLYHYFRSNVENEQTLPNAVLYFSHDKALMKVYALLGLFKPVQHLLHSNLDPDRKYRTSFIMPFASNMGFVLYKCNEAYKVAYLFQGNPVPVPDVCSGILCDWEDYEAFLRPISQNCDLSKLCMLHDEL